MNILLTGHSGFLGSYLIDYLGKDHDINTLDRANADVVCDLTRQVPDLSPLGSIECVVHASGKAHVIPKSAEEEAAFYDVNFKGTQKVCAALERANKLPRSFVFISTVAVYGLEWGKKIKESAPLNGDTPYARSKIEAENWLRSWSKENGVCLTIFRLPLVAGAQAPGNLGAMVNGIKSGRYFRIGKGASKKSIVLASDVARIIPQAMQIGGTYNLTDGYDPSFAELEALIAKQLDKPVPRAIPLSLAKLLGWTGDIIGQKFPVNSDKIKKITSDLTFDDSLAKEKIGWAPQKVLDHFKIA